jgi:molybdopterin/thiamine biosynthesis adenylyltransferase
MTAQGTNQNGGVARHRLADARVLVVGVGALGCPAAHHLAAAGIGTLVLLDPDRVEMSNLQRQVLHRVSTIGMLKVDSAAAWVRAHYPAVRVEAPAAALTPDTLPGWFRDAHFVIDATDGATAKFLINDGAVRERRPFSHAGVLGFLGQTMTVLPGQSACYRCLFPEPPPPDEAISCADAGVIGGIAGVIGSLQAAEAIKYLSGDGELLTDRLLTYDALTGRWRHIRLPRNPRCPVCADPAAERIGGAPAAAGLRLDAADRARYGS